MKWVKHPQGLSVEEHKREKRIRCPEKGRKIPEMGYSSRKVNDIERTVLQMGLTFSYRGRHWNWGFESPDNRSAAGLLLCNKGEN